MKKPPKVPPATMKDVAKLAGVSQTTVSFVINDTPGAGIAQKTKDRVWAAVAQLNYRPNVLAQNLRTQRSGFLGFITDEIAITPYAGKIVEGAQDVAWQNGKILLLVGTKNDPAITDTSIDMLLQRHVEGIIYATMFHRPVRPPEALHQVPTVLLDCFDEDRQFPSVVPKEEEGGYAATTHLLEHGHRRVGFINNERDIPATHGRMRGYEAALSDHGIPVDPGLIRTGAPESEGGYNQAMALMETPSPPTAIFCFNDRVAMGAYDAIRKLGLSIPEDVAIVGFDNQEIIAAHLYPALTTLALPHYRMGEWAVSKLVDLIEENDDDPLVQHQISCDLIERESV